MKTLKLLMPVMLAVALISCGDDDEKQSNNFTLNKFFVQTGFTELEDTLVNSGSYEFGLRFKPLVDGSITSILVKLPDDATDLRVTFWDAGTGDTLQTDTIPTLTAHTAKSMAITPVVLEKDHEYMITFNSNDWYEYYRVDGDDATYPINVGQISITGYGYHGGVDQVYPSSFPTDYYAGDLSFVFVAD